MVSRKGMEKLGGFVMFKDIFLYMLIIEFTRMRKDHELCRNRVCFINQSIVRFPGAVSSLFQSRKQSVLSPTAPRPPSICR